MARTSGEIVKNIKSMEGRIARLAKRQGTTSTEIEERHRKKFEKQAQYMGGYSYEWCGVYSTDTRELFLLGVLICESQELKHNYNG